jgi:hypothetical protein
MKNINRPLRRVAVAAVIAGAGFAGATVAKAAPPVMEQDAGAYVRLLGNPADGTAKFQYGWMDSTEASNEAAGYWVGLYDVTNSTYLWVNAMGPVELPDQLFMNAKPTPDLPNGEYKVVFFVRDSYAPTTNVAEIELPFTVDNSMM